MKFVTRLFFISLFFSLFNINQSQAFESSKLITTIQTPEPIKRIVPEYPVGAARSGREGWAKVSFIIEESGAVSGVIVTETSGSKDFAKAAKKAVRKWKYKPAFENGKPIQQCVNLVQLNFRMNKGGQQGVSRRFISLYKETEQALKDKKFDQVETLLKKFEKFKYRHMSENNYYHLLASDYAKAINDHKQQLYHLYRISYSDSFDGKDPRLPLYNEIFALETSMFKFKSAFKTYNKLLTLEAAKPYMAQFEQTIVEIEKTIKGNKKIVLSASLDQQGYWWHELNRPDFSITDLKGDINKLDVRCANKRHIFTFEKDNVWEIPDSWQGCSVFVSGTKGTQFSLVEYPAS